MNNTITYKLNGKIYDVPDDKSKDFESQYKDATVAYKVGEKIYDIPVSKKSEFLSEYKDAEYYDDSRPTNIGQDQNTEPATSQQKRQGGFWGTWIGDAIEKLNAGGAMIGKNLFGALDKATLGVEKLGLGTRGGAFKNLSDYFKGVEDTSRANSDRYNGKSYSDLWKEGDYAGAIGDIALQGAESLPMSIAAAASTIAGAPIAGLAGIGALTANEKYDQLDAEHPDMDEFAKVTNAILTGTAEGASEMLGAGVSKAWMKTLYKSLGKEKAEEAIKKGLMGQMQKHYKEFGMFYEPIEEGIEEVASQLAENITDKITGVDPDRDITDGLKDSFVYGMGGGAYFSAAGAPGFAKRQYEKLKTRKDLKDARENFRAVFADNEKILGLESELENSTPEEKAVFLTAVNESKQFSPEEKEAIGLLVDADVNYRSWRTPEAVEEEKAERKELAVQTGMINYDNSMVGIIASNGMIQQVYVNGDMQNPVAIIEGDVALTPKTDGTMAIDRGNSSEVLYYKDADGRTIPISPRNVTDVYNVVSAQDQRAQYEANLRAQIDMQEQARAQQRKQEEALEIENEDSISYIDPDTGKQVNGIVRDINPGGETMSVEIDGGKLATVPKEIVVKSTIQTVPVQESRDQSVDSPLGNETVTDLRQNAEQPTIEAPVAETAEGPKNGIVTREDGTPDFIASGEESSLDFLAEKYGDKMRRKVEVTKNALNADLEKAQKALLKAEQDYDDAPIGKEDKAEQVLRKAQETYDAVKKEADFWTGLNEIVTQEKPGDQIANDIKEMGDPLNGEELVARLLATGAIKLTRDSYKRETGAGNQESKKMFGLFASPEKGGVSIERAGELVMTEDLEAGTNFFDQDDPNAGRNAIIAVLSSARTRGDLINYIKNAREKRAEQEREAEYNEYAAWCEDNYHMSPEDYEAYEEDMRKQAQSVSDEAVEYVNGEIADEIQSIKEEQEEIDAILAQNKNKQNEEIERNDQGRTGGLRERSDQLLQEEQLVQTGRVGEIEQKHAGIDGGVDLTDGVTQESTSGEIDRQGNPIDSEGNLIIEDVNSVSDITDEDFTSPYRTIGLPSVPKNVSDAIGADGKRVIIKKNIFEKNSKAHAFPPQSSRDILGRALYNPDIVGQSQPNTKKNHWVVIKLDDKSPIVVLEVNNNKDNVEIVGWYTLDNRNLDRIRRQAKREGGELLILTSKEAAASLSTLPSDLSSTDKDSESASNSKEKTQENETSFEMMNRIAAEQKAKHDISEAEQQVDVNPTEAQKEAGNYKKGHIQIDGFDISIEQPKESVRSGKDASGKEWSVTMNNTYGYIRGTEGVDGDHIDVFLSDSPASGRVYVVDQVKDDGSFDEHKVMYGFNSEEEAKAAYLSNYSPGWKGLGNITEVSKDDFKKWIDSSKRKTKPFADYKIANKTEDNGKLYKIHSVSDIKNLKTFVSDQLREKGIIEENNPEEYAEIYDDIVNSNQYAEYIGSIISNNDMQYLYDHMPVKTRKQDLIELKSNLSDAGIELEDIVDTRIKRTERKPDRPLESLSDEDNSVIGKTVTIKYFDGTFVKGVIEKLQNGKISVRSLKNGRLYTVNKSAIVEDGSSPDIRFRDSKRGNINVDEEIKSFANKHNLNEADVKKYAQSIKMGNLGGASYAFISIKRIVRLQNSNLSLGQFAEVFNPIKKELYENFGDVDALRDEYTQKEMEARNVMEAARKRAEEEAKAEKKRLEEADNGSNVDAEYFAAIERGDMEEAQRIVNEAADRAGYSVGSDYQGASAFNGAAPYGNGYFITKEERKEAWEDGEFEGESTLGDYIDNGVDGGNLEVLTNGESYRTADEKRKEAIENVRNVIEGKRRTITMYRSVPSSVKEGKFRNGDWVTPSRKYAMENAKIHGWDEGYRIIEQEVSVDEVWFDGNDIAEWGYGREEDFANDTDFAYKNTKNNRKLLDAITRDDKGNIIPPSNRFNARKADVRFHSVRNVFPKNNDSIVKWILDGKLTNVDKEKLLNFFDQQRTNYADVASVLPDEQVKQRNSEVSSATKVVESFVNPTLEEGKISSSVEELSESLNTPAHIIRDVNDITDTNKELQRQKQGSKGWYDTKTGEVYLVLPNAESVADAQATILHETVAHKGLRGLLGDNFGPTMDFVFDSLPQEVQSGLMDSYGDRVVAAEEYCAEMAETMTDPGIIQKICSAIKEALRKIGINLKISDGDIMYMLWKSKNRLENSDTAFDIMRKAKTDAMVKEQSRAYDNLFRSKKPLSKLGLSDDLQRRIEGKMQSRTELFQEAYVDRMISVKKLQEEVEKAIGKKIPDYMNVYVYENTLSSRNTYEQEQFEQKRIKPLLSAIKGLRDKGYSEREIENYVLAKHGIERNEYMRYAVLEKAIDAIKDETLKQQLLAEIANKKFSDITQLSNKEMDELRDSLGRRDFAGLTGTYADMKGAKDFQSFLKQMEVDGKTIADFMPEIENFISDMEISNKIEISNLWDRIRAVNEYSLKKWFDTGMINRKTYDKIKGMYENYVPLRGFAEAQMSDVFDYFSDRDIVYNETVKTAKGRTSRPDSPFAYMASVGDSAIVGGNKNQMKLHLLRMAMDGATDMLTVNKQWYEVSHDANGNEIWTPAYPVYDEDPDVYRKNIEDFEADMLLKKSQGLADTKRGSLTNDLDEKSQKNLDQHAVKVKLNGEEYVVYVNGNPKIAQAVNGLNTPEQTENKFLKGIAWMNREMAANFTTRNPAFILSNLSRDLIWASSTLGVKENGKYQRKFMRNVPKAMKALKNRIKEGEEWKPNPNDPTSVMLDEFLRNGGRTGYTALYNIDKYKNRIEDATKTGKKAEVKRKAEKVFDAMGVLNEWAEDISRFATFMTSRQMGRSLLQSTYDAKEVTVNFNRKGSGAKGNEWFRAFYIFFNAAVQSLNNAYNMAVKNPGKALALAGGYMTAGAIIPLLLQSLGDDDDKEKYMGLPDYVRKNNVCIPLSMFGMDGFLKIPLPIELRAFYGIGDSFIRYIQHYDEGTDALTGATMGLLDLLPLNPAGGASNFVPSYIRPIVESYVTNKDFTGKPIAKITPFNEYDPEYQKVYKSTGVVAVKLSEYLNALAGGDEAKRKFATFKTSSGADLLNPASVEHLFEAYLGGAFTFANQSFKTFVGAPSGLNDFSSRNIPVLNRFYDTGEVDGTMIKVNEKFFKYVDDAKKAEATYRNYEKLIDNSPSLESAEYMKKLDEYEQSDEWKRAEFILDAKDEIGELNEEVKESTDENYVKFLKEEIASKKKEMVDALKGGKVPE